MDISRRHHWVAQHHLRRFADRSGLLHVYQRGKPIPFRASPKNVAAQRDLYRVRRVKPRFADFFERLLATFLDGPAASAFRRIEATLQASPEDRDLLASAIAAQIFRTPLAYESIQAHGREIERDFVTRLSESPDAVLRDFETEGISTTAGGLIETARLLNEGVEVVDKRLIWLEMIAEFSDTLGDVIHNMTWRVMKAPREVPLVLSDLGLSCSHTGHLGEPVVLRDHPEFDITVPINPFLFLLISNDAATLAPRQRLAWYRDLNYRAVDTCMRFIFCHRPMDFVARRWKYRTARG